MKEFLIWTFSIGIGLICLDVAIYQIFITRFGTKDVSWDYYPFFFAMLGILSLILCTGGFILASLRSVLLSL